MKPIFVLITVVIVVSLLGVPVAADGSPPTDVDRMSIQDLENENSTNESENGSVVDNVSSQLVGDRPDDCDQHIDAKISLCEAYLTDGETAVIKLYSESTEVVTMLDSAVFLNGGRFSDYERTEYLRGERTTTIRMPVEVHKSGAAGVSITTRRDGYGIPLEEPDASFLPGSPSSSDAVVAGLAVFSVFVISLPISYVAVNRLRGGVHHEL